MERSQGPSGEECWDMVEAEIPERQLTSRGLFVWVYEKVRGQWLVYEELRIDIDVSFVPPRKICWSPLIPQNVNLFGNNLYRGSRVKLRSLGWALVSMTGVLMKRGNLDPFSERRQWEDTGRKLPAGQGRPQASSFLPSQGRPEARREAWNRFPLSEGANTATPWFWFCTSRIETINFCGFSSSVCGALLEQP